MATGVPSPDSALYGLYAFLWLLEKPLFAASLVGAAVGLWRLFPLARHRLFAARPNPGLGLVRLVVVFSGLWFWWILATAAASDILGFYTGLYVFLAYATLLWCGLGWPVLRLYHPADVLERRNGAAAVVIAGFSLGTAFAYGGALTGEGPGWFVVVVFFALAYGELRGSLAFVDRLAGRLVERVRLERDLSAAILLAGVAVAAGLVSGRAAAGDFLGWEHALRDYGRRLAVLPAVPLLGAAAGYYTGRLRDPLPARAAVAAALVAAAGLFYALT